MLGLLKLPPTAEPSVGSGVLDDAERALILFLVKPYAFALKRAAHPIHHGLLPLFDRPNANDLALRVIVVFQYERIRQSCCRRTGFLRQGCQARSSARCGT